MLSPTICRMNEHSPLLRFVPARVCSSSQNVLSRMTQTTVVLSYKQIFCPEPMNCTKKSTLFAQCSVVQDGHEAPRPEDCEISNPSGFECQLWRPCLSAYQEQCQRSRERGNQIHTLATSPHLPFRLANLLHSLSEEYNVVLQ